MVGVCMSEDSKLVKVCSKCGSTNWFMKHPNTGAVNSTIITCHYCRHVGVPFEVTKKTQDEMHKNFEKKYGKSASVKW